MQHLVNDETIHVPPVLAALKKYTEVYVAEPHTDAPASLLYFSLWQAARLVERRWPWAEHAEKIRRDLESTVNSHALSRELVKLLDRPDAEEEFQACALFEDRYFIIAPHKGLLHVADIPEWMFAVDFSKRSITMIHRARKRWADLNELRFHTPGGGHDDIVVYINNNIRNLGRISNHF